MCHYRQFRKWCPCRLGDRCAAWSYSHHEFVSSEQRTMHLVNQPWTTQEACDFWKARVGGAGGHVNPSRWCPYSPLEEPFSEVVDMVMPEVCALCSEWCRTRGKIVNGVDPQARGQ